MAYKVPSRKRKNQLKQAGRIALVAEEIKDVQDLINFVSARPRMFTPDGRLEWIGVFVDGFASGRGGDFQDDMVAFEEWFSEEVHRLYNLPRNHPWWLNLSKLYPDDAEAIEQLPDIFRCYKTGIKLATV